MGKGKKSKKKGQGRDGSAKSQETELADASGTWRGGTGGRKPLMPFPSNAPMPVLPQVVLKTPVVQIFGPAWIHNNVTESGSGGHDDIAGDSGVDIKSDMTPVPVLVPESDENSCIESFFNIEIDKDVSLLKDPFEMKDENELPAPMASFCPLERRPKNFYSYYSPWNARNFAHKIKSQFLSFHLACSDFPSVGNVDFISDVENIKRIMQMKTSDQHESYICHRIGNTVLVDKFDLQPLYWKFWESSDKFWPWFENFVKKFIGVENEKSIKKESCYSAIRDMEALHFFFYSCLKGVVPLEAVPELTEDLETCKYRKNPITVPNDSDEIFLRRYNFQVDKFQMNLGSNIPVLSKSDSKVTLRTHNGHLSPSDLTDIYLEQLLLGADQTYVAHHEDMILKRSEWLSKNTVLNGTGVPKKNIIADGIEMLQFLKDNVIQPSHSYWLYKAPSNEHILVNLDLKMQEDEESGVKMQEVEGEGSGAKMQEGEKSGGKMQDGEESGVKMQEGEESGAKMREGEESGVKMQDDEERGAKMKEGEENGAKIRRGRRPYSIAYASLLYRYCETFHKVMKSEVAFSMLKHARHILYQNNMFVLNLEPANSVQLLECYFKIRQGMREIRPDISDPSSPAANHKPFEYYWKDEQSVKIHI